MLPSGRVVSTGGLLLTCSLGSLLGCKIGALIGGTGSDALRVVPERVVDSATVGSATLMEDALSVTAGREGPRSWTAHRTGDDSWLALDASGGDVPDTIRVSLDPTGLPAGVYGDTIIVSPSEGEGEAVRVPVELRIKEAPPAETAGHLEFAEPPSDAEVGETITPAVRVAAVDEQGDVITTFGENITLAEASGPGALQGTLNRPAQNGVATFADLHADKAGSYTITASAPGLAPETSETFQITAPPAPTPRLEFRSPPQTTTAGATMPPVEVVALDAQGNTVTSFTGTITLALVNAPGASLGGHANASAVAGVATFENLSVTKAGSGYRLEATTDGFAAETSRSFAINPGDPHHLVITEQPTNTPQHEAIDPPVKVAVHDVHSNVVTAYTGTVFMEIFNDGSPLGNATLDQAGRQRAANTGVATFEDLRIDQVGIDYTLQASAEGTQGVVSEAFNVTLSP
jgi:hypothetical protein